MKTAKQIIQNSWINSEFKPTLKHKTQETLFTMVASIIPLLSEDAFWRVIGILQDRVEKDEEVQS
tara:strand:- start:393 stop:587 length:195 start_codon:yes stop_codon:yes gene_type:complete